MSWNAATNQQVIYNELYSESDAVFLAAKRIITTSYSIQSDFDGFKPKYWTVVGYSSSENERIDVISSIYSSIYI